jgi:nitrogen fixation/metabolism regulation signal transduction histidine kinase
LENLGIGIEVAAVASGQDVPFFEVGEGVFNNADSGDGITGEQAASMLSENNHTSKPDGHGIGMLIVRRVMREHNGFVEIESKKDTGSIIYLKLPLLEQSLKRLKCEQV